MTEDSYQHRRNRQRPTRVGIVYDVETGGAMVKRELPFIMGVLSDLSGDGNRDLAEVADRSFVEITPDNFDKVLKGMNPRLEFAVDNQLDPNADDRLGIELSFERFADFSPEAVAERVPELRELLEKRKDLSDLKGRLLTNRTFSRLFQQHLNDDESKARLLSELDKETTDGEH